MLVEATAKYRAGGYPMPTYTGVISVGLYISDCTTDQHVNIELVSRARRRVASSGCFDRSIVNIWYP